MSASVLLTALLIVGQEKVLPVTPPELANLCKVHGMAHGHYYICPTWRMVSDYLIADETPLSKELHINSAQRRELKKLLGQIDEATGGFLHQQRDAIEERLWFERLSEVLQGDQLKRFRELQCQWEGLILLRHPWQAERMKLSAEQRATIKKLEKEYGERATNLWWRLNSSRYSHAGFGALHHVQMLVALGWELEHRILAILTSQQRQGWKKWVGTSFDWSFHYKRETTDAKMDWSKVPGN